MYVSHSCALFPPVLQIRVEIEVAYDVENVHKSQRDDPQRHRSQEWNRVL